MAFFDFNWFGKRERVYNLDQVYNDMRSLIDPENTLHDLHTIRGIHEAFKKADILQSIEITCRDYSKNCKVFTKKDQKEVIINPNLKGQTFTDVYSEINCEKTKYSVSIVRKIQGAYYRVLELGYYNIYIDIYIETEEGVDIIIECKNPRQIKRETFATFGQMMSYEFLLEKIYGGKKKFKYIIATSKFDFVYFEFMKRFNLKYDVILNTEKAAGFWINDL